LRTYYPAITRDRQIVPALQTSLPTGDRVTRVIQQTSSVAASRAYASKTLADHISMQKHNDMATFDR
jgi:hypothetical protein